MAKFWSPFSFTRGSVTLFASLVYLAIITVLVVIQTTVPAAPKSSTPLAGVNLTEAWLDLQLLSGSHHPYNSHQNDDVRTWLLSRIHSIISKNQALQTSTSAPSAPAYVFDDTSCNITFSAPANNLRDTSVSVYFDSTNIIVYVRGDEDDQRKWWNERDGKPSQRTGILVNAHYDSVSTGFGATDDGVGVISILQLLEYYTTPGNAPKHGLVLLLNNGEEDFLNGATAFSQHPMSRLVSVFLNLEGAGAGGRATLFRSTNVGVTRAYAKSRHPFGTVISGDGFERGLVRSQTDYVVFNGAMGLPGLDVAFFEPRARYHTAADSTRHTNKDALWHMLDAAISTTRSLTKSPQAHINDDAPGVWFDLFGQVFAVFRLHTLFALSVTLLIVAPLIIILTVLLLYRADKLYVLSGSCSVHTPDGDEKVSLYGWRGVFRFPLILLVACAAPIALAYLLFKENPFIAHSSEWAVWSMMASSFVFLAWFLSRVADFARPSALTRVYGLTWFFVAWWVILVIATVFETQLHLAGTYFVFFYFACVFLAAWTSYLELFSLPKKSKHCVAKVGNEDAMSGSRSGSQPRASGLASSGSGQPSDDNNEDREEPTERSGLLGDRGRSSLRKYVATDLTSTASAETGKQSHDGQRQEQEWSKSQWTSLWILQFLFLVPINLILLGQIGLIVVAGLHQTGSDGSSMFLVYLATALFSILLFSPLVPFIHRFTWHVPMFTLLVLVGTLIYNLTAFPFSSQNRLKIFFLQEIDLTTGVNNVSLIGVSPYVQNTVSSLPSAAGQNFICQPSDRAPDVLKKCSWHGIPPEVVDWNLTGNHSQRDYTTWLEYNITHRSPGTPSRQNSAQFTIRGLDTRACKLSFYPPHAITSIHVHNSSKAGNYAHHFPPVPSPNGAHELHLWSRTWNRTWTVDLSWDDDASSSFNDPRDSSSPTRLRGKVTCLWSDVNRPGLVPAYDECLHYVPEWVVMVKATDGLVEGFKEFTLDL